MSRTIALLAEGNAEDARCWSGSARQFVAALRRAGAEVTVLDVEPRSWDRYALAALSWRPDGAEWQQRFGLSAPSFHYKSWRASVAVASALTARSHDAVVQIGATFAPSSRSLAGTPHVVYCDGNVRYARKGGRFAPVGALPDRAAAAVAAREQRLYDRASRIWCMSDTLAASFAGDFGVPTARLRTIRAGVNVDTSEALARRRDDRPPMILFVGREHERKGSALVLAAFERVRAAVPDAELHFVGSRPEAAEGRSGVTAHGFIAAATAEGREALCDLYARATVFCLPSRYEPFGIVFLEAMLAGLPCVGADRWAMPELIRDGETGTIVPDGDVGALSEALVALLRDRARAAAMGLAARERVLREYSWDLTATRALDDVRALSRR